MTPLTGSLLGVGLAEGRCSHCRRPVVYAYDGDFRKVALDPEPRPDGTLQIVAGVVRRAGLGNYVAHEAVCKGRLRKRP